MALTSITAHGAGLAGFWCNSGPIELEAGIKATTCPAGTVGMALEHTTKGLRAAGVELLCGEDISPVFAPFHLAIVEGSLYTAGVQVGTIAEEGAFFTLSHEYFTRTDYELRLGAAGAMAYDEVTRDVEGWVLNRNRGEFRLMPVGTRSCAGLRH